MECNFVVGQKVVCVDAKNRPEQTRGNVKRTVSEDIEVGRIYTIREIFMHKTFNIPTLRLVEVVREQGLMQGVPYEMGFAYDRFVPLKERKTSISTFTEILNKVNGGNHDNNYGFNLDELFETVQK